MEEILMLITLLVAFFIAFLMLSSGHRRQRLRKAMKELQTERMRILKSIEHVKLSFYKKKIGEKEAQDKIFEYEERLRETESKILEIKEKPLMRTLKKQEKREAAIGPEEAELERAEVAVMRNIDAKVIVFLFAIIIVVAIIATAAMSRDESGGSLLERIEIPISAASVPSDGLPPGSNGGLRVYIENNRAEALENVRVWANAPEGSGIEFDDGELAVKDIPYLEAGGSRELYFAVHTSRDMEDGEYVISIRAVNSEGLNSTASAKLIVRLGKTESEND